MAYISETKWKVICGWVNYVTCSPFLAEKTNNPQPTYRLMQYHVRPTIIIYNNYKKYLWRSRKLKFSSRLDRHTSVEQQLFYKQGNVVEGELSRTKTSLAGSFECTKPTEKWWEVFSNIKQFLKERKKEKLNCYT